MNLTYRSVILLFMVILLLSQGLSQPPVIKDSENNSRDTLTVAAEPEYPPYSFVNQEGNPEGLAIDLMKEAAKAAGLNVKFKIGVWSHIKQELANGQIDALPLVGRTPEREELFDFTMPYLSLHGAVFVREENTSIKSLDDLKNKEIIVMKGDNAEEFVRREELSEKIFTVKTFTEAFKKLESGQHDAIITQRIMGIELLDKLGIESIKPLDIQIPEFRQDFCFAVKEGDDQLLVKLNEGLSVIIANGTYDKIRNKWLGPKEEHFISKEQLWEIALFVLLPLLIIAIIGWIFFLRREVKNRTSQLNKEIEQHKASLDKLQIKQKQLTKSEEQIRLLLNSTAEGIYGINRNGECTFMNRSALMMLGFDSTNQVLGKNMHNLIHHTKEDGSSCSIEECNIFKALREGKGTYSDKEIFWHSNGNTFPVEYYSYPIKQNNEVTGAVITFSNITEKKQAQRELLQLKNDLENQVAERTAELNEKVQKLNKSQKAMLYMVEDLNKMTEDLKKERQKLKESNKELEAFAYSISHDLRAPLRAINGYSAFLQEDFSKELGQEGSRYIQVIKENASKMDHLITDLLNLSRVSRSELKFVTVDMNERIKTILQEIISEDERKEFEIHIGELPKVKCDSRLIRQVWQNLLGNALKYSANSKIKKIEIDAQEKDKEIVFSVKDHGAGFNAKYKNKLFGVFQRLHRENEFEGTGVGLAIVQRIIHRHGGNVWAEGEQNKGAVFYFSLLK
ncbi:MAG: transporter substrate-binding domain-containing protein [Bacteroidota bacterium]